MKSAAAKQFVMTLPCNHLEYTPTAVYIIPAATSTSLFPGTSLITTELSRRMNIMADAVPVGAL